ncbi:MAG TPA: hypothetical protein VGO13_00175 [Solirubrobacterales bacterium]|jgi:hypothetical protein|nr:hypothetical protein [Solirubrobacterales bacterium]
MARGICIGADTAKEARERFLAESPERTVIACELIEMSDIPLRRPLDKLQWAIAFEDPDPSVRPGRRSRGEGDETNPGFLDDDGD